MKKQLFVIVSFFVFFGCAHKNVEQEQSREMSTISSPISFEAESQKLQEKMAPDIKKHATPEDIRVMSQAAKDLADILPSPGLSVGERAPDFTLPNAFGQSITLSEELKKGPVVLVFYRGSWCPFCNLHLHTLQSIVPKLKEYNAQIIAVTPQQPDESAKELQEKDYPFEVVSDLDYLVSKAYNLYFDMQPDLVAVYEKFGIDLEVYNGKGRTGLPVPGTLVIDGQRIVQAVQADTDYKKRMEPAAVVAAIEKICQ